MGTYAPGVDGVLARRIGDLRYVLEGQRSLRLAQLIALSGTAADSSEALVLRHVLTEVEAALARIEDGTYGVCLTCWQSIPIERLEALPHARDCSRCDAPDRQDTRWRGTPVQMAQSIHRVAPREHAGRK